MSRRGQGPRLKWLNKRERYYIVWSENGRSRERSTGTTDREIAEIALAEFLNDRQRKIGSLDPSQVLVTDLLGDYSEERGPLVVSPERIAYATEPLSDFWLGKTVAEINQDTCHKYVEWRERSDGTLRRELGVMRASINYAHKKGRIIRPVAVWLPKRPEPKTRWLERSEVAKLLKAAKDEPKVRLYLPLFIIIAFRTGARKEAILSLKWSQVDLENKRIDFNPVGRQLTNKRRSRTPISTRLLSHLQHARKRSDESGYVINRDGQRLSDIKKGFAAATKRAGLTEVTPHVLRHTCATWLMQAGVDKYEACGFLAMTLETLERTYAHHHPDHMKQATDAI